MAVIHNEQKRQEIVDLLTQAYWMEIETVMSYIPNSINPDGVRAEEVKESLADDIKSELGHALLFANRIKDLHGQVPGSMEFHADQRSLQPPSDSVDVVHVIKGVIEAEQAAVDHYTRIIQTCEGVDYATQDMVIDILKDEQRHLRQFEGFLREYESAYAGVQ